VHFRGRCEHWIQANAEHLCAARGRRFHDRPHICDGDIVVFRARPGATFGQIVAALIDRKNTLKTFLVKNGKPFLKAENPKYPDLIPSEELVIQGVFRALIRRAKE
jgi:SOS-response transcriptional repressor LexA